MHRLSKKTLKIAGATAVLLAGAGGAFAYWTNTGAGTGTATSGTSQTAVTVNQTAVTGLYPGQAAQPLSGTFNNPNAGATYVTAVTTTGYTIDGAHSGCTVAQGNYTLGGTSNLPGSVPSGNPVGAWSGLTITMNETNLNQDACKGAIVTVTYASS